MITYRTFSDHRWRVGWSPRSILEHWNGVRQQARDFIQTELNEGDVVSVAESCFGNGPYAFCVTVWYKKQ